MKTRKILSIILLIVAAIIIIYPTQNHHELIERYLGNKNIEPIPLNSEVISKFYGRGYSDSSLKAYLGMIIFIIAFCIKPTMKDKVITKG